MAKFQCEECGGVFEKGWSDEEAAAESQKLFGNLAYDDAAVVCDDCFKRLMAKFL